jgi:hypothetical protein
MLDFCAGCKIWLFFLKMAGSGRMMPQIDGGRRGKLGRGILPHQPRNPAAMVEVGVGQDAA